jgi:hypothetical protein
MKTIFLIVWLITGDGRHAKLADDPQPDAPTCFAEGAKAWGKYTDRLKDVHDAYELQVSCQLDHDDADPA